MVKALNGRYQAPSRDNMANTLVPAWYNAEKEALKEELQSISYSSLTSDGWTSIAQDHYITITIHYIQSGKLKQKVLQTKAVYVSQTGEVIAEDISQCLDNFGIQNTVTAITVDNAANMTLAIRKLNVLRLGCFAHTLNLGAQKIYSKPTISRWFERIRAIVLWFKRIHLAKVVLTEKQKLLGLPQHTLILDVKTRWNYGYLMVERFGEQIPCP